MTTALDFGKSSHVRSARAEYSVMPRTADDTTGLPPVTFGLHTGVAHIQDYLTPTQADDLADALRRAAQDARVAS